MGTAVRGLAAEGLVRGFRARTVARVVAPVVALAALAGCSASTGGTAFDVSGDTVSNHTVDQAVTDCVKLTGSDAGQVRGAVADWYLQGLIGQKVAQARGLEVTEAQKNAMAKDNDLGRFMTGGACQDAIMHALTASVAVNKLGKSTFQTEARRLTVKTNPRYGTYNPQTLTLSGTSGSLSDDGVAPGSISGS